MNIALSLDGVLRNPTGDLIQKGLIAYRALKSVGRVILLTELTQQQAEAWLLVNNLRDFDDLIDASVSIDPEQSLRDRQLEVCMSRGPIFLYVEANPQYAASGLQKGLTTLLFVESLYSHYGFRPDASKTARPWDELVAERTRQQTLMATDRRLKAAELGTWE